MLEEAAYFDPSFFYETVALLMLIRRTSLLAISTLTSEINFYSRLIKTMCACRRQLERLDTKLPGHS